MNSSSKSKAGLATAKPTNNKTRITFILKPMLFLLQQLVTRLVFSAKLRVMFGPNAWPYLCANHYKRFEIIYCLLYSTLRNRFKKGIYVQLINRVHERLPQ